MLSALITVTVKSDVHGKVLTSFCAGTAVKSFGYNIWLWPDLKSVLLLRRL